jgi:RNA polymerase sigma factor (sigma-70 family)
MPMPILSEKITNEELVDLIKRGVDVTANYELLYEQNKNLIRMMVKPYAESANEDLQDLMQEAYFGLVAAVEHYEPGGTAKFMTFASYWVKNSAQTYVRKSALLKVPAYESVNVRRYKRFCNEYERDKGYMPGDDDVSGMLHLNVDELDRIKSLVHTISSLDAPIADSDSLVLSDTLSADGNIEEDTIDSLMDEQKKTEIWEIVEKHVTAQENAIVKDYYLYGCTMPEMAKKYGVTYQRIAQIKHDALGRLRRGKAKKELQQRFEVLDSSLFSGGFKSYCNHDFTSNVEYIAMRKMELQKGYDSTVEYLNREYMQDSRERLKALQEEYEKELQKLEMN